MKQPITTSLFELFKIGPGPSSSHTIGPMRAAGDFRRRILALPAARRRAGARIVVEFFGSLSDTGVGHGSDRATVGGLLGFEPESCDTVRLAGLLGEAEPRCRLDFAGHELFITCADIVWAGSGAAFPWQNTMRLRLLDAAGGELLSEIYYSIGGGFILREGDGAPPPREVPFGYTDMTSFRELAAKTGLDPVRMLRENELACGGHADFAAIDRRLDRVIDAMLDTVERGLAAEGVLPGPIRLQRRAKRLFAAAQTAAPGYDRATLRLNAFVLAAAEENAAGNRVVTAPTSGSAGLMSGMIYHLHRRRVSRAKLRDGLLIAGLIGFIAKHNSSISGAEVGCQGEIGVASAMAAALLAQVRGCDMATIECAAEIALEHHLGLTCDPIGGYVQIPCIERNAVGAVAALNAALLAGCSDPARQKIRFDQVVAAMLRTGLKMPVELKETSRDGLALCSLCD
jgi:L-serine dehydratase